ncbi:MAG: helix-turn-helix domain-containing protein [Pseudomonas sp.]
MSLISMSTRLLEGKDKLDQALDNYSRVGQIAVDPVKKREFAYDARFYTTPQMTVGKIDVSACRATRSNGHAAEDGGFAVLGIACGTDVTVDMKGRREFSYSGGDAFLWRGDEPGSCIYHADTTPLLNIAVSRELLDGALTDPYRVAGCQLPASAELRLLAAFVNAFISECEHLSAAAQTSTMAHIQDLLFVALGPTRDAAHVASKGGTRAARLRMIMQDVEANLCNPSVGVAWATARHRISERYLRALFADHETTFTDHLNGRRLQLAYRRLCDAREASRSVSTIAYESGFGDLSWFNRAFRRRFGMSPGEVRKRASQHPSEA